MTPLLSVQNLTKYFPAREGFFRRDHKLVHAVDGVSLEMSEGEVLGLVGESGSGKTTTGRLILRLIEPTGGSVLYRGENIFQMEKKKLRQIRREIQIIFQDPYSSLNPRMRMGAILEEPLIIHGIRNRQEREARVRELLGKVGLDPDVARRYPHEFSGGQRQRIGVARALMLSPRLVVADEPVSSLDVSVQAQIINLLEDLQHEYHLSLLFIAHDLTMVRHISNRVAVMYLGRIVEMTETKELFRSPRHPYTEALLSSIPRPDPSAKKERILLEGDPPSPIDLPTGCRFASRCPKRIAICDTVDPELKEVAPGHFAACHLAE